MEFCILILFISGVTSLQLSINPTHLDAGVSGAVFKVSCKSDEPLTHCHFKWRDIYNNDGPLIDLSEGIKTPPAANYSYLGNGLDRGECGISLNRPTGVQRWVVSCRVRSKDSGWHYNHMTLFAHLKSAGSLSTSPRQITVHPGEDVKVQCNSSEPLVGCAFRLPDGSLPTFNSGIQSPSTNTYGYSGTGLNAGHCGITLYNVTESNNGFLWCQGWKDGKDEWRSFALTVAAPPSAPVLEVRSSHYTQGDFLRVTCAVARALPVANITWYLDQEVIRQDHVNEAPTEPWLWPFQLQTFKQTLTRQLLSSDAGKELTCKIKQVDYVLQSSHTITFWKEYTAPHTFQLDLQSTVFNKDDTLSATCTVKGGYPLAQVTWFLGSRNLTRKVAEVKNDVLVETVTEKLRGEDDGSAISCVVSHPRLSQPFQKTIFIIVKSPPQVFQNPVEEFKFKVGSPGVATVAITANPRPSVYWTVDDSAVQEGTTDVSGVYEAAFLVKNVTNPSVWIAQLFINNVTLRDLKVIFFLSARNEHGGEYFRCVHFNTTKPADVIVPPKMILRPAVDYYSVGASINATCTVTRNRPIAKITWLLSNATLTKGVSQPILLKTDSQGKHVIVQSITLQVGEKDDGNQLKCIAGDKQAGLNISVMYPPKKMAPIIELFGFEVGKPGVLSVKISANPQPRLMWEVSGIVIQEDEVAAEKRFHAPQALPITRGNWMAKLFVTNITETDIGSDFALTARNQVGSRTYRVRLWTSTQVGLSTTTLEETSSVSKTDMPNITTHLSVAHQYSTAATSVHVGVYTKSDHSAKTTTIGIQDHPQAGKIIYKSSSAYSYLSIANSIAIVMLSFLGCLLYIRLRERLFLASQGIERTPMCLENLYYNEVNSSERQHPHLMNCDS